MRTVKINGITFTRTVEMLGEVEKVTWFSSEKGEVLDTELASLLEHNHEQLCLSEITPELPII